MSTKIKDSERGGKAKLITLDSGKGDADCADFWKALGGTKKDVQSADKGGDDEGVKVTILTHRISAISNRT